MTARGDKTRMGHNTAGWSLYMLSILLLFWNADPWGSAQVRGHFVLDFFSVAQLTFAGTFLAAAVILRFGRWRPPRRLFAGISLAAWTASLIFEGLFAAFHTGPLRVASLALCGIAAAAVFLAWQRILAEQSVHEAGCAIIAASTLASVAYCIIMQTGLGALKTPLMLVSGLGSAAICLAVHGAPSNSGTSAALPALPFSVLLKNLWRPMLCVGFLGFLWEFIAMFDQGQQSVLAGVGHGVAIAQIVTMIALLALWVKRGSKLNLVVIYQVLFPIIATGFLFMPFLGFSYRLVLALVTCIVFGAVSVLMQVTCIQASHELRGDVAEVTGVFAGVVYLLVACGYFVGCQAFQGQQANTIELLVVAMLAVYACALVFFIVRFRGTAKRDQEPADADSLAERCEQLGAAHDLTQREVEVLILLARGRDLPYISEKLFISKNTVRSHTKNIYRKLDVHTKQELMDIVDVPQP